MSGPLLPKHGGYRRLKSFQVAQLAYDVTLRFCDRYIDRRSRTHDQMVQAARSGVQNIAEGSQASGTSRKTEIRLTNVARASLEELRLDYEDFLRQRGLSLWEWDDHRRTELIAKRPKTADDVAAWVREQHQGDATYPELAANGALALLAVACSLLDRQLTRLGEDFEKEGGFTERLHRFRRQRRGGDGKEAENGRYGRHGREWTMDGMDDGRNGQEACPVHQPVHVVHFPTGAAPGNQPYAPARPCCPLST
ncbi:MAG: four helix bundle protein [Victivallales bacterium]|nr:four helix bundle protein [Victivallales bacterium]